MATTNPDGSVNIEDNLAAHAILGALLSAASSNSALAGGLGALSAEAAANLIKNKLYGDKYFTDLTEDERQNISALSQIAATVAGGLTGDSISDAAQGAIIGKNAVENNYLSAQELLKAKEIEHKIKIGTATDEEIKEIERLLLLDVLRDEEVNEICSAGMTAQCIEQIKLVYEAKYSYAGLAEHHTP